MARVLENVGKDLLKENGVPTPEFIVAATSEDGAVVTNGMSQW